MHVHGSAVTVLTRVHYKKSHIIACALIWTETQGN